MNYEDLIAGFFENKKTGRKRIIEEGYSLADMSKVYAEEKSLRRAAARLGISTQTLHYYIKAIQENRPVGRNPDPNAWESRQVSAASKWVREQTEPLPRSVKELAKKSGLSVDQFYYYFKRRVRAAKAYLNSLGDLRDIPNLLLVDIHGRKILAGMFANYELTVDKFSLLVTIRATLKFGGHTVFKMSFGNYKDIFDRG